jgi:tetratricopeptide (TPR) repeat protein
MFSLAMYILWRTRSARPSTSGDAPCSRTIPGSSVTVDPSLRLVAFGICWFFLTLAVESSLVPLVDVIAEHRLYLPAFGMFAAFAAALSLGVVRFTGPARAPHLILGVTLLLSFAFGFATYQRNHVWGDGVRLWRDVVAKSPDKARGYNNLGEVLNRQGRFPEAIVSLSRAIKLDPFSKPEAYINLGFAYIMSDRSDAAVPLLKTAIRIDPESSTGFVILAMAYNQLRLFTETVALLEENLDRLGRIVEVHYHLGVAYAFLGDVDAARRELETVSQFDNAAEMKADLFRLLDKKTSMRTSRELN